MQSMDKKATIHQVTTMLATSKNVLFLVINTCSPPVLMTLHFNYHPHWRLSNNRSVRSSAPVVSRWLWPGNRTFLEMASMVVTYWIVFFGFFRSESCLLVITMQCNTVMIRHNVCTPPRMIWDIALKHWVYYKCSYVNKSHLDVWILFSRA